MADSDNDDLVDCYDAENDRDLRIVKKWHNTIRTPLDNGCMRQLKDEAEEAGGVMQRYLRRAIAKNNDGYYISCLKRVECVAVLMYTDDDKNRAFSREFNLACREGKFYPYLVYTSLLFSALRKLARNNPLPEGTRLYRGLTSRFDTPDADRMFWKTFTSCTTRYEVAKQPGFSGRGGTIFHIRTSARSYAARPGILSSYEEHEVILLPFEEFIAGGLRDGYNYDFKTSRTQKILPNL